MPPPVTPPKTLALIGALIRAATIAGRDAGDDDVGHREIATHEEQAKEADHRGQDEPRPASRAR